MILQIKQELFPGRDDRSPNRSYSTKKDKTVAQVRSALKERILDKKSRGKLTYGEVLYKGELLNIEDFLFGDDLGQEAGIVKINYWSRTGMLHIWLPANTPDEIQDIVFWFPWPWRSELADHF